VTTYDDTVAEDRSGPSIRLLYLDAVASVALGVFAVAHALLAPAVVRALTARDKLLGPNPAPQYAYVPPSWPATMP